MSLSKLITIGLGGLACKSYMPNISFIVSACVLYLSRDNKKNI